MPRIDPVQLLKCLSVLLSPQGGIKSKEEVQRLASLMTKFSKKLVSKCIYIQILKRTEMELLGSFMGAGGWNLIHIWLTDGIIAKNWSLIQEILELLLLCPVDVERLKTNNCPKLVKELSKETAQPVVQVLATKLVEQWLKLVKGESAPPYLLDQIPQLISNENMAMFEDIPAKDIVDGAEFLDDVSNGLREVDDPMEKSDDDTDKKKNIIPVLKISLRDGKQIVSEKKDSHRRHSDSDKKRPTSDKERSADSSKSSSKSSSKHRHSKSSSSDHKHSSSGISKNHRRSSSSSSSKDIDRHRDKKHSEKSDKDKKRSISDKSRTDKSDRSSDKDRSKDQSDDQTKKDTPNIMKLGKIPKKPSSSSSGDVKKEKPSISIEVRKPVDGQRPRTVKTFNSKFRSHGLEEEAKPAPPRVAVKKPNVPPVPITGLAPKRPSPIRTTDAPPEKRLKIQEKIPEKSERPGGIQLIPAKPKPSYLLESGLFMDALTASAINKKEPKKRKRRISGSKDSAVQNENSPPTSPNGSSAPTTPTPQEESKPAPPRFYQDTLDTEEEDKDKDKEKDKEKPAEDAAAESPEEEKGAPLENPASPTSPSKAEDDDMLEKLKREVDSQIANDGVKGVLSFNKKKGPKKSLKWRDTNLEEVHYFEMDETERVNVTRNNFMTLKSLEHSHERESFKKGKNISEEEVAEEKMVWRKLVPIEISSDLTPEPGKNSKERAIQEKRHANTLPALYFHKSMIPDSPAEADLESHVNSEPVIIPLDDGNPDTSNDFQNTPWPEPKSFPPNSGHNQGQIFPHVPPSFNPNFNNPPFGMPPGFHPGNEWHPSGPNMHDGSPDAYSPGGHPMGPGPGPMYQGHMADFPMMEGPNYPGYMGNGPMGPGMNRPMGGSGPPYFNRGGMRGGPHWRGKGPGQWNGPFRGNNKIRGKGRVCAHFSKKGFCREGDSCQFIHAR